MTEPPTCCGNPMRHNHLYSKQWEQRGDEPRYPETEGTTSLDACDWHCEECGEDRPGPCDV